MQTVVSFSTSAIANLYNCYCFAPQNDNFSPAPSRRLTKLLSYIFKEICCICLTLKDGVILFCSICPKYHLKTITNSVSPPGVPPLWHLAPNPVHKHMFTCFKRLSNFLALLNVGQYSFLPQKFYCRGLFSVADKYTFDALVSIAGMMVYVVTQCVISASHSEQKI